MIFSDPGLIPKSRNPLITSPSSGWKGYAGNLRQVFHQLVADVRRSRYQNLIACTMAAYAFARLKFAGRNFWFAVMLVTLMLPGHVTHRAALYPVQHIRMGRYVPPDNRAEVSGFRMHSSYSCSCSLCAVCRKRLKGGDNRRMRESRRVDSHYCAAFDAGPGDGRCLRSSGRGTTFQPLAVPDQSAQLSAYLKGVAPIRRRRRRRYVPLAALMSTLASVSRLIRSSPPNVSYRHRSTRACHLTSDKGREDALWI